MTVGELLSEVDLGPKIFEPDGINDMQADYDSQPQDQIPRIRGSPEGVVFGRIGVIIADFETGILYQKTTPVEIATGWVVLGSAGGGGAGNTGPFYGVGSPEGVQIGSQGAIYSNDAQELWQKASPGTGNTGWIPMML
jgi:hypothetical protein